ncbi:MAG: cysteine--tRNA ligase [Bacteroidetes bacterium]|nr:cysteine--tRNA ligase [Bacteroidota bacterium]
MPLSVYNTLTRQLEPFLPIDKNLVRIYVCGPTVYGDSHLGHAKSYVSFDVIVRYLRFIGYRVLYVQNITDVGHLTDDADEGEDKLIREARANRVHPMEIAERYTRSYFEDMDALGVLRPDISPRASGHSTEQIELVKELLARGLAYEANGSVYFDVRAFAGYGKLSGRTLDELSAGVRIDVKSEKRYPADFALWKKAEPGHIMRWPSPWGEGFPGWHVECSAMSMKYLGQSIDIHGGGLENQFPHHECEIAQSEGATGKPFVKYWLHNNMVTVDGRKMGKSLGNSISLKEAFKRWSAPVVRFFVLQSHYRSTLDFSEDALRGAAKGLERLHTTIRQVRERLGGTGNAAGSPGISPAAHARALQESTGGNASTGAQTTTESTAGKASVHPNGLQEFGRAIGIDLDAYAQRFRTAMDEDFNAPQAIAALFDLSREVNSALQRESSVAAADLQALDAFFARHAGDVLGILPEGETLTSGDHNLEQELMSLILSLRAETRKEKLWTLSDKIRDGLTQLGITLEDKKEGTTWKRAPKG